MNPDNILDIPRSSYGTTGITTGNLVYHAVKSKDSQASIEYDSSKKHIVIKNLSKVTFSELSKLLYSADLASKYEGWYPRVENIKDLDGNFLIKFSGFPPTSAPVTQSLISDPSRSFFQDLEDFPTLSASSSDTSPISLWPTSLEQEKVAEVQSALSQAVIKAISLIMTNEKKEFTGVWYPEDLKTYFASTSNEMPSDFLSGYASEEYFEKIGFCTFKLKEGKLASKAIETLIAGPSVLDCGNATQLAYYKAILDVFGTEKFDSLFSSKFYQLKLTQNGITDSKSPISYFSDYTAASKNQSVGKIGERPLSIGEECHFKGSKFYANKHPTGWAGGWNVIYAGDNQLGEQLFVAHGFGSPKTEREIHTLLVEGYNRERTAEDELFIREANKPNLYDRRLNPHLRMFYTMPIESSTSLVDGFLVGSCRGLNAELVTRALLEEIDIEFYHAILKEKIRLLV